MANEPEIKHARSFAITKTLSLITEQGTEVPCCLDPRTMVCPVICPAQW